jgi:hypothetical protein
MCGEPEGSYRPVAISTATIFVIAIGTFNHLTWITSKESNNDFTNETLKSFIK